MPDFFSQYAKFSKAFKVPKLCYFFLYSMSLAHRKQTLKLAGVCLFATNELAQSAERLLETNT